MNMKSSLTWGSQQAFAMRAMMVVLLGSGIGGADEQQHAKQTTHAKVEVRALEIRPSHDCEDYEGRFLFINHGKKPLTIQCSERPMDRRYLPNDVQFQILKNGVWEKVERFEQGLCWDYDILPGVPCELDVDLRAFKEQNTPLTCRVIFDWDKYPSEPFVLDWKADHEAGRFLAAKKAYVEKLRDAFLKSGFRPELLKGDDFPYQILKKMITAVTKSGEVGAWFGLYKADIEVSARLFWKGDVFVEFRSLNHDGVKYEGFLQWNPGKLSRAMLQKLRTTSARVVVDRRENASPEGVRMVIDPKDEIYPGTFEWIVRPFVMGLSLDLPEDYVLAMPGEGESMKAFDSVMDFLKSCIIEEKAGEKTAPSGSSDGTRQP
jgi:hypothetical protein